MLEITPHRFYVAYCMTDIVIIFYPQDIENHLINALRHPVDKLIAKDNWFMPSSMFFSSYYMTPKAFTPLSIVGLSLNIEHSSGVSLPLPLLTHDMLCLMGWDALMSCTVMCAIGLEVLTLRMM